MLPVLVIVGRPNVGKSTLFNCLTGTRDALVADEPGITRDRLYGTGSRQGRRFLVVDTGGLVEDSDAIARMTVRQAAIAIEAADAVLLMVDARAGLTAADRDIVDRLRRDPAMQRGRPLDGGPKRLLLVLNKIDGLDAAVAAGEFHELGLGDPWPTAATHGRGVRAMLDFVLGQLLEPAAKPVEDAPGAVRVAIIGRPNVGKSTLANRLLGEERVLAHDAPGTTRDSIQMPFEYRGRPYVLIDTAGVRRRARVSKAVEKFSVLKSLQAIDACNAAVLLVDAREGVTEQDLHLLGLIIEAGSGVVIGINKWDAVAGAERASVLAGVARRCAFADFVQTVCVSARSGTGLNALMARVQRACESAGRALPTALLTQVLAEAVDRNPPPLVRGRRIKLRYAHQGGRNPPVVVVHGNQTARLPDAYRRFLSRTFREALGLEGTPVRIELKSGENPFQGRRNVLTPRQARKRRRVIRHSR